MSELNMMPVPIVQMGLVEKLVEVEQNQPHVQQLVAQESAKQAMKAEAERVPQVDSSEHGKKIRNRDSGQEKKERRQASNRSSDGKHEARADQEDGASEIETAPAYPWDGKIVNMKV